MIHDGKETLFHPSAGIMYAQGATAAAAFLFSCP
jgi:hypothetical protein